MANSFEQSQQKALELLNAIENKIKDIQGDLVKSANTLNGIFKGVDSKELQGVTDTIKKVNQETNKMISLAEKQANLEKQKQAQIDKMWKQREAQIKKETDLQNKKAKDYIKAEQEVANARRKALADADKQRALEQKSRESLSRQKKAALEYARAYNILVRQQKEAKKVLQDMIVLHGKDAKATKQAQKEYDRLSKKVNQANAATSNFAKTGLGKTFAGFRNLLGAFGLVGGVTMFADFAKSTMDIIKELDKLQFTLEAVSKTEGDVARSRQFLIDLSLQYGADIISTTERYVKFSVAARNAGLEAKEVENIFGTVTKASAVLGLKTDELTGIYLALEQMLSKGKVTTEELRRQLGERLPGAFDLAAKAMGVTSGELDTMLKKGQVVASDLLPKLRVEIEKAFGLESLESVNTLQTATEKLSSSWKLFIEALNNGTQVGNAWQYILERMAIGMKGVADAMNGLEMTAENKAFADYYKELQDDGIMTFDDAEKGLLVLNRQLEKQKEIYEDLFALGIPKPFTTIEQIKEEEAMLGTLKGRIKALEEYMKLLVSKKGEEKTEVDNRRTLQKVLADLKAANDELNDSTKEQAPAILDRIDALNKEKEAWERRNKAAKESTEPYQHESSIKAMEDQLSKLKEMQSRLDPLSYAYASLELPIKTLETALKGLNGEFENQKEVLDVLLPELENFEEMMNKAIETVEGLRDESDDFLKEFTSGFLSDIGFDFLGKIFQDFDKLKEMLEASEDDWAIWATSIMEIAQEAFNFFNQQSQARFDKEYENLEREKEIAILFAGESATAREEIERQYEEKKQDIRRREAAEQKKMAIFNATIDTAQAIVAALAIGPPQGFVFAALAAALGAAQIAMISSTPEPSFFRGTMNAPEGWANVDEKRPEVHTDRQGRIKSFGEGKANKRWLEAGDRIYTSREEYFKKELGDVLQTNDIVPFNQMFDVPNIHIEQGMTANDLRREIKGLKDTIRDVEPVNITLDKRGVQSSFGRKEILNNQLRIKRRRV